MRKTLFKVAALSVCIGLLLTAVPNVNAVEKRSPKFHFLKKSAAVIQSIIPFFTSIFDSGKNIADQQKSAKKVKITGGLSAPRISDGD